MTNSHIQSTQSKQNKTLNCILKSVSRSFYLSIRILPKTMREPIGIAYLLARAADAITDVDISAASKNLNNVANLNSEQQLNCLLDLRALLSTPAYKKPSSLDAITQAVDHEGEKILLSLLPDIFIAYYSLSPTDHHAVKKVVTTLTMGMEKDLQFFTQAQGKKTHINALPNDAALDEYTFYVAGCVGEFWTELSIHHTPALQHWQRKKMSHLGIQFGKALQLTNILRDIAKDAKLNRCYLPETDLQQYNLTTDMLLDKNNNQNFLPVISKWLKQADLHFNDAEEYLLSIPSLSLRLRLASLWPILIGLATLKRIKEKENFLDINVNVKVKRSWVYKMLILSVPAAFSNTLLRYWIKTLRNKNHHAA